MFLSIKYAGWFMCSKIGEFEGYRAIMWKCCIPLLDIAWYRSNSPILLPINQPAYFMERNMEYIHIYIYYKRLHTASKPDCCHGKMETPDKNRNTSPIIDVFRTASFWFHNIFSSYLALWHVLEDFFILLTSHIKASASRAGYYKELHTASKPDCCHGKI